MLPGCVSPHLEPETDFLRCNSLVQEVFSTSVVAPNSFARHDQASLLLRVPCCISVGLAKAPFVLCVCATFGRQIQALACCV